MAGWKPSVSMLCAGLLCWTATTAGAQPPHELRYDLTLDLAAVGYGVVFYATVLLLKDRISPSACRWCDQADGGGDGLNGLDRSARNALRWTDVDRASSLSDLGLAAFVPALALGFNALAAAAAGRLGQFPLNGLFIVEAILLTNVATQVLKMLFARQRPNVHFAQDPARVPAAEDNLSFFSGHASISMALAVASGTVASLRGYRWAPLVWALAVPAAMLTGYLRIAGDRHYFTDVLTGAVVGGFMGFAIPYFFHGRRHQTPDQGARLSFVAMPGGARAVLGWQW